MTTFVYLKRQPYGAKQKRMWLLYADDGKEIIGVPVHRLRSEAEAFAKLQKWVILPDGMTPELWHQLRAHALRCPFNWRQGILNMWYTGADESVPWVRQLRNTLGPKGLAKFKF